MRSAKCGLWLASVIYARPQGAHKAVRIGHHPVFTDPSQWDEFLIIRRQLIRSATSVAANYRASQRAKSKADSISKLGTVEEEADESLLWLECLAELCARENEELKRLLIEADELLKMVVASKKRARI